MRLGLALAPFLGIVCAGSATAGSVWLDRNGDGLPDPGCDFAPGFEMQVNVWIDTEAFTFTAFQITIEDEGLRVIEADYTISGGTNAAIDSTSRPSSIIFAGSGYTSQGILQIGTIRYELEFDLCSIARPIIDVSDAFRCQVTSNDGAEAYVFPTGTPTCVTLGECFDLAACCLPDGSCFLTYEFCDCEVVGGQFLGCGSSCSSCDVVTGVPSASAPISGLRVLPNPSHSEVYLELHLAGLTTIDISVYDASGRRIRSLLAGPMPAGTHSVTWDRIDTSGHVVAPGTYFLRLTSDDGAAVTERVTILR